MLRHDDDHSGHKYRQDFMWGRDSNEEWSVKLFRDDASTYGVKITDIDFKNFSKGIYVTTFAQDEKFFDKEDLKYRDYGPKTIEDFFIVFADIGGAMMHGWDYWLEEWLRYMEEFWDFPSTLGEWIDGRKKFLRYQESIYDKISPYIIESYRKTLEANLKICQDTLIHLESGKDTETLEKRIAIHPESIS